MSDEYAALLDLAERDIEQIAQRLGRAGYRVEHESTRVGLWYPDSPRRDSSQPDIDIDFGRMLCISINAGHQSQRSVFFGAASLTIVKAAHRIGPRPTRSASEPTAPLRRTSGELASRRGADCGRKPGQGVRG